MTFNLELFRYSLLRSSYTYMVHNGMISVTQQRYPQQPVPVYSYGPPTYQGPGGQQHAYGRNNISVIDCQ